MSEQYDVHGEQGVNEKRGTLKRRGLIAGAAALVAGVLAKQAAEPVAAGSDGDVVLGVNNFPLTSTGLTTQSHLLAKPAFMANNDYTGALDGAGDGMQGYTTNPDPTKSNAGVFGRTNDLNGVGIFGEGPNGTGAFGDSGSGTGVAGNSSSGTGVYGVSSTGTGVYGVTSGLYGVRGDAGNAAGSAGLLGYTATANGIAFGSVVVAPAVYAGFFNGATVVAGNFAVTGSKSAAVKDASGTYRLMHCVEAPEPWFEDFGTGTIVNGKASVTIDPEFVHFVNLKDYHVFLTENGGTHSHLSVHDQTPTGFTVSADHEIASLKGKAATDLNGTFSWRLVAKRADISGERLAKTEIPHLNVPKPPQPKTPKSRH